MRVLVVLGHQRKGSFCHAITDTARTALLEAGHEVICHDLYEENFDPILRDEEYAAPHNPNPVVPPTIQKHCDELLAADGYVVVHPNWWGQPPAMLKGWIDRVIRQGLAYSFAESGVVGHLKGKRALVITTSNTPRDVELAVFGDPLENLWKTCVFGFCGVENFKRRNFEPIILSTPEQRAGWLEETRRLTAEMFPPE